MPPIPCGCCPVSLCGYGNSEILFTGNADTAVLVANPGGYNVLPLNLWSDGSIAGAPFTGFTGGPVMTSANSPTIDLIFSTPKNGIRGLREWNQGGGDLFDSDGFAGWDVTFMAPGLVPLLTQHMVMANGAAPFTMLLPGTQVLNNVERVRLTNMSRLIAGGVAPLTREVRALQRVPVFPCRLGTVLHWYDENGVEIAAADVTPCNEDTTGAAPSTTPLPVSNLFLNGFFFGDDSTGLGENLCNFAPAPTSMVGFSPVGAGVGCLNPVNGTNSLTWAGPLSSASMEYSANGQPGTGASLMQFSATGIAVIQWPAGGILALGQSWNSLPFGGGHYAKITATTAPVAGTGVSFDGGSNVRVNANLLASMPNFGFKIEFFA